jgi:hypothetical protein
MGRLGVHAQMKIKARRKGRRFGCYRECRNVVNWIREDDGKK